VLVDVHNSPIDCSAGEKAPLMGSGPVSLQDPELPPAISQEDDEPLEDFEEDTVISKISKPKRSRKKKKATGDSDWHEDEEASEAVRTVRGPRKNCLLHMLHWFEGIAIISCLGVLVTQILPLLFVSANHLGFLQSVLRIYVSLFSITFILVELRVPLGFLTKAHLLQTYFSRGLLYTFLGVVGMEEAYSGRIEESINHVTDEFHVSWAPLFMQISSWLVFAVGCIYMIFGMCCLQILRDKLHQDYQAKKKEYESLD
jgi:hypothetical protein